MPIFECKNFDALLLREFHDLLALRSDVFVVEQNCVYQDIDGKDPLALHVIGKKNKKIIAYARIINVTIVYPEKVSIGRIVIDPLSRGKNHGNQLISFCLDQCNSLFPGASIKISAQAHLERFYNKHRFVTTGEAYLEDGIPHIGMLLKK
jgi:ElaA protein